VSRALIAGIGNIFMADDAFGCEVALRLGRRELPPGVEVVDFGIRARDLGYALTDGYDFAILIDTVQRGGTPGTVYVIEPDLSGSDAAGERPLAAHDVDSAGVLRLIATLGERRPRVLLVGCEPEYLGGEGGHMGLSAAVSAAVDEAAAEVERLLNQWGQDRAAQRAQHSTLVDAQSGGATRLQEASI
jgi:hydrogenase maturation protease